MKRWLLPLLIILLTAAVVLPGIGWGLPSADVNRFLFGSRPVWTGKQIIELAGDWDTSASVGADVDRNPLTHRDQIQVLNDTDAKRAEIVRRYRLFSYQPDEMITFRALSQMRPGGLQLDPKLYQYGGLWIYPIGGLLKVSSMVGLVQLRGDLAFYLDHPEEFGKFYVVARAYSALWGVIGAMAVFGIVRKLTGHPYWAATTAVTFALLPVVVCMSHEAKPHLAGAVLTLLAMWAALRFIDDGKAGWAILAGALCGAAMGMIVSAATAFAMLPLMVMVRDASSKVRLRLLMTTTFVGIAVYAVTNPYVVLHLFSHRELLFSNLGNTGAMYGVRCLSCGVANTIRLLMEGSGWLVAFLGFGGWITLHFTPPKMQKTLRMIAAPAVGVVVLFALVAADKPGEFGRFMILPATVLLIGVAVAFGRTPFAKSRLVIGAAVLLLTLFSGGKYLGGFVLDAQGDGTRAELAGQVAKLYSSTPRIAVLAEPAPYCLPPVDLFSHELLLLPAGGDLTANASALEIHPVDVDLAGDWWQQLCSTRISWADKPFVIRTRTVAEGATPQ